MKRRRSCALGILLLGMLVSEPTRAGDSAGAEKDATGPSRDLSPATVQSCVSEHERAHMLRVDEQWLEARAAMAHCGDESCPLAIRSDCRAWLDELARILPTLLVVVERDDGGTLPVRLEIDGKAADLPEVARPIEILPGEHRLRFVLETYAPIEREVLVAKGEKNHVVNVRFAREPVKPAAPPDLESSPVREPSRPIRTSTYLFGGGALVAFATSSALLVSALSSRANARATCAPTCDPDVRTSIESRLLLADISGGAGVILTGLAVYSFVTRPAIDAPAIGLLLPPSGEGAMILIRGQLR